MSELPDHWEEVRRMLARVDPRTLTALVPLQLLGVVERLPALLEEVEQLRRENASLRAQVEGRTS